MIPNDSKDYYPTPPALAAELLAGLKIDGHSIEYAGGPILEPSAGSGDLARAIEKAAGCDEWQRGRHDQRFIDLLSLDCIEQSSLSARRAWIEIPPPRQPKPLERG